MKTIGLIGGMSWESTVSYYQTINRLVNSQLGGLHSAKICLHSVDFAEIEAFQRSGEWDKAADALKHAAKSLEDAGADFLLICTNTMHKVAAQVASAVAIPLLHIADATGAALSKNEVKKVGLLGTQFTMEQTFYTERLAQQFDLNVIVPDSDDRLTVHKIIYEELCKGVICEKSREAYIAIINKLKAQGAQAVILGCTEIALLVKPSDTDMPLYDTTALHAAEAVDMALQ
ncbi:aspartate/glutamate racemase family protein [Alteromonas sp. 1_MG-2023]|uniref:aspartate/glutamate racemase family protein n=1 Tax=Alteromonas sp. 1_MG-2023 TaxID=3062669 RepID=UPI0026E3D244|nr:aspartate/glutamate racemase family protein [Alteromonas sp. 1_MG-2023]MDO6566845.1 aspartate/glutamate racemase family protein [Alteromonas sp. 1_MG-2023]